jgi:hypothetical protein
MISTPPTPEVIAIIQPAWVGIHISPQLDLRPYISGRWGYEQDVSIGVGIQLVLVVPK